MPKKATVGRIVYLKQTLIVAGIVGALLAGGEVVCRLFEEAPKFPQPILNFREIGIPPERRANSAAYANLVYDKPCKRQARTTFDRFANPIDSSTIPYPTIGSYLRPETMHEFGQRELPARLSKSAGKHSIYMFGGSTTAGDGIKCDEDTLPANLEKLVGIPVLNLGNSGHNFRNESAFLLFLLRYGHRPKQVIFYDGANDALHRVAFGVPYMAYARYARGEAPLPYRIALSLLYRSALARTVARVHSPAYQHVFMADDRSARIFDTLRHNFFSAERLKHRADQSTREVIAEMTFIKAILDHLAIPVTFFLQPTLFTTDHLSAEEQEILQRTRARASYLEVAHQLYYDRIRRQAKDIVVDASGCLNAKRRSVFVDFAHVSPAGNELIARCLAARLNANRQNSNVQ